MISGSYTALITPFSNGELDEQALRNLVELQVQEGTVGLIPVGTTGEACTLSYEEHKRVVAVVVEQCGNRAQVIAGAGSNNPVEALEFAQYAQTVGADAVLCVAGYYNRPNQQGLYEHFKVIHDNTDIDMYIYNIPPRAIVDIQPTTMQRLSLLPRVIGVKDATGDLNRINEERMLIGSEFSFLSGEDMTALGYRAMGGNGCISVTANVAPKLCAQMQNYCAQGDYGRAFEIHQRLLPLHKALFLEPSPAGVKYAASLLGICQAQVRLPIIEVSLETQKAIQSAMQQLELIV